MPVGECAEQNKAESAEDNADESLIIRQLALTLVLERNNSSSKVQLT